MNPTLLRKEIEDEMQRTRLDKTRLYELILKIVDSGAGGGGSQGPAGPAGPAGPVGPACKCKSESETPAAAAPKKTVAKKTTTKKTTATKKATE